MATLDEILKAKTHTDLFPTHLDDKQAQKRYIRLQRIAHPDVNLDQPDKAAKAFIHLTEIWELRTNKTQNSKKATKNTVQTKKHAYLFTNKLYQTPTSVYYEATYDDGHYTTTINFANKPQNNSKFLNGIRTLSKIRKEIPDNLKGFFPNPTDVFIFTNKNQQLNAANLETEEPWNNLYTFKEILNQYPQGIPTEDVAWIYKRMLITLNETHKTGHVHANGSLTSYLVHPQRHGMVLVDWENVTETGQQIQNLPSPVPTWMKNSYATPKLDISIAANLAYKLCDTKPSRFRNAMKGASQYPPEDAEIALKELSELTREIWGTPKWHEFNMPLKA